MTKKKSTGTKMTIVPGEAKKASTPEKDKTPTEEKKTENKATHKKDAEKLPAWLNRSPRDFVISTPDYKEVVEYHNKNFGTDFNTTRVPPFQFTTILERVKNKITGKV